METETLPTPVVEGAAVEPAVTETPPVSQEPAEPQPTTTGEVESGSKEPQVPAAPRRRPSDYYQERQTIRELKQSVAQLQKQLEKASLPKQETPVAPEIPDFDPQHFSPEHKRILLAREQAREKALRDEIASLRQEVSGWKETRVAEEADKKQQEALEKLFPKTSPDSKETLMQRIAKDPERAQRIQEFLVESGLNELSRVNPDLAVKYALLELGENKAAPNPLVLKKSLVGSNGTGTPGGGGKPTRGEQDLRAENRKISEQLDKEPALRFDEKFMARRRTVLDDLQRLVTEKR